MRLGKMLRTIRLFEGRDAKDVAAEIGVSASTLYRIEHGQSCDMRSLGKFIAWMIAEDDGKTELMR